MKLSRFVLLILALGFFGPSRLPAEAEPEFYFFPSGIDLQSDGSQRPLDGRVPVIFVHGFRSEDLKLKNDVHITFSFLRNFLVKRVKKGLDPFAYLAPFHYVYRPGAPYPELGRAFGSRMRAKFGDQKVLLVTHSAGALIARYAQDLSIEAVISMAPAHGGSPGASIMWGKESLQESGRLDQEGMQTLKETLRTMGVEAPISKSLAWDNADQVITSEDQEKHGVYVHPEHPPFRYHRYDHYGRLSRFVAPFAALSFVDNAEQKEKSMREREWEVLGKFSPRWAKSDGVVVPYPRGTWDAGHEAWIKTYRGVGHRDIFIERKVLEEVWSQAEALGRRVLGKWPEDEPLADPQGYDYFPPSSKPKPPALEEPLSPEEPADPLEERVEVNPPESNDSGKTLAELEDLDGLDLEDLGSDLDSDLDDLGEDLGLDSVSGALAGTPPPGGTGEQLPGPSGAFEAASRPPPEPPRTKVPAWFHEVEDSGVLFPEAWKEPRWEGWALGGTRPTSLKLGRVR